MKQKLGLACALIHTPKVLFLDEPTNGVDPVSRRDFWRILYQLLREKVTIFVSTAYLDEAERCNRLALIHQRPAAGLRHARRGQAADARARSSRSAPPSRGGRRPLLRAAAAGGVGRAVRRPRPRGQPRARASRGRGAKRSLAAAGLAAGGIRPIEPSLEDVFVSVLAEKRQGQADCRTAFSSFRRDRMGRT